MPIQILEPTVAAQIAAGEVVERPASIVKELIENAIDAGARRVDIEVRGGGVRELKISDDGCGIPSGEIEIAFERHATSKLRVADDLWSIATLGFRGEALPSIASVSQLTCITRTQDEELGTELRIAGGELQARTPRGCSRGTTFIIRNLFYNVPVRREFLRSEATEASAISAIVTQYALAYPEVRFTMLIEGRLALRTNGTGDLRESLVDMYGLDVARQLLPVESEHGEGFDRVQVRGMVSPPGITRGSRGYLHVFVNRRAIQPRGQIAFVIEEAYHTMLMKGRHPIAVLDIQVHPGAVDVNIHPTKSEVKFRDSPRVMSVLGRSIRDALIGGGEVRPWADAGEPPQPEVAQRRFELRRFSPAEGGEPARQPEPLPEREIELFGEPAPFEREASGFRPTPAIARAPADGDAPQLRAESFLALDVEDTPAPGYAPPPRPPAAPRLPELRIIGQVGLTYIIAESPEGMYMIDQHAAHERVSYERLMRQRGQSDIEQQGLLMPQVVELPPQAQQVLLENRDELATWGFAVEDFGTALQVRAVPAGITVSDLPSALAEIADNLMGRGGSTPADWREAILTTLACHTSIRAGQSLSLAEMRELIVQLEQCEAPRTCPHGRPTMILMSIPQLERQFGRIK
ncbi:DNA mismatch repair endonuclease MutL [Chloroflexia bacterium SDU3-3]|nr:DNA mismatch repair endonuclease MutL [Chloroflexia bacterium SDU3-3]